MSNRRKRARLAASRPPNAIPAKATASTLTLPPWMVEQAKAYINGTGPKPRWAGLLFATNRINEKDGKELWKRL